MIYLDNAATTFPKPLSVRQAVDKSFLYSANPGRAGHSMSLKASEAIYNTRENICSLMNFEYPERVILTSSCTQGLNIVIKGTLNKGDHVVISSLEHNSVLRPIQKLTDMGVITYDIAEVFEGDADRTLDSFRKAFKDKTKLCVCTHASNVFGIKLPVSRISALCHFYNILFCLDASQTAGLVDIDINDINADFICAPGHKGLYGPLGTGFLIINTEYSLDSLTEGGTGSGSSKYIQPDMLPDKFESGTLNLHGFAGLSAGIDYVKEKGIGKINAYEMSLINHLYDNLQTMKGVTIYTQKPGAENYVPLLSFTVDGLDCDMVSDYLDKKFSVAVRAGLHCSPLAHKYMGTDSMGTIRVSPSSFSNKQGINTLVNAIYRLTK